MCGCTGSSSAVRDLLISPRALTCFVPACRPCPFRLALTPSAFGRTTCMIYKCKQAMPVGMRENPEVRRGESLGLFGVVWPAYMSLPNRRQRAPGADGRSQRPSWPGCSLLRLLGPHTIINKNGFAGAAVRPDGLVCRSLATIWRLGGIGGLDDSPTPVPRSIELSTLMERSGLTLPMIWTPLPAERWASWGVV
jgi:hypothetical protein